jgi:hypothetical protein
MSDKGQIYLTDEEFFNEWLDDAFDSKKVVFDILIERYRKESDPRIKSLLCSQIFSLFQAQVEDLALLMSGLQKKTSEIRNKTNKHSFFYTLLSAHTDAELLRELEELTRTINPNHVLSRLGLPLIDQVGGRFWGYKPKEFLKEWDGLSAKLELISTSVSDLNRLGRRIGNKVRHFGFFRKLPAGKLEVLVDIQKEDFGVTVSDYQIEIMREAIGGDESVKAYQAAFDVSRELIEFFIMAFLKSIKENCFALVPVNDVS